MADRLVDLRHHLFAVEDQRGDLGRAVLRREEADRLARHPLGLLHEREGADPLVAGGQQSPARRAGEGSALHLAVPDRRGRDAPPGVRDRLLDGRALAGRERGPPPVEVKDGFAERQPLDGLHPSAGLHQEGHLLVQRNGERVLLDPGGPGGGDGLDRRQADRIRGKAGGGPGDLDRQPGGVFDVFGRDAGACREPPVPVHQDPDADALGEGPVDALHLLVPDRERLGLLGDPPCVGVSRPGSAGGLDSVLHDIQQGSNLSAGTGAGRAAGQLSEQGIAGLSHPSARDGRPHAFGYAVRPEVDGSSSD